MTLKKMNHEFKNKALSYDAQPNHQPCIKLSFFFNKLPDVSYEQFHRHVHLPSTNHHYYPLMVCSGRLFMQI